MHGHVWAMGVVMCMPCMGMGVVKCAWPYVVMGVVKCAWPCVGVVTSISVSLLLLNHHWVWLSLGAQDREHIG